MSDSMPPQAPPPGSQPPYPYQQPQQQQQQPAYDPNAQNPEAFGFEAAPSDEKYNTEYLVTNLNKDRARNRLIVVAVIAAAVLGVLTWVVLMPEPKPVVPKQPGAAAVIPPAADTPAADAAAEQPTEP